MQSAIGNFDQAEARINADSTVPFPDMTLVITIPVGYALPEGIDAETVRDMCLLLCTMIKNGALPYELQQRIMGLQ